MSPVSSVVARVTVKKRIAILGSTGSIGQSALAVVDAYADRLEVIGLAAGDNADRLAEQCKVRTGAVDRVVDDCNLIGRDLFSKDADLGPYLGMSVALVATGMKGRLEGGFGQGGKFRCNFPQGGLLAAAATAAAGGCAASR